VVVPADTPFRKTRKPAIFDESIYSYINAVLKRLAAHCLGVNCCVYWNFKRSYFTEDRPSEINHADSQSWDCPNFGAID